MRQSPMYCTPELLQGCVNSTSMIPWWSKDLTKVLYSSVSDFASTNPQQPEGTAGLLVRVRLFYHTLAHKHPTITPTMVMATMVGVIYMKKMYNLITYMMIVRYFVILPPRQSMCIFHRSHILYCDLPSCFQVNPSWNWLNGSEYKRNKMFFFL